VALKNLEIIEREKLCENAEKMGNRLHHALVAAFATIRTLEIPEAARGFGGGGICRGSGDEEEFRRPQDRSSLTGGDDEAWRREPDAPNCGRPSSAG
jgi:hypothetical protein